MKIPCHSIPFPTGDHNFIPILVFIPQNGRLLLLKILLQPMFQVVIANLYDIELLISVFDLSLKLLIVDL